MDKQYLNTVTVFSQSTSELKRFKKLFCDFNFGAFVPVPAAIKTLPKNHKQNTTSNERRWSKDSRGYEAITDMKICSCTDNQIIYEINSVNGVLIKFFYIVSQLCLGLEIHVFVDDEDRDCKRFFMKNGNIQALDQESFE